MWLNLFSHSYFWNAVPGISLWSITIATKIKLYGITPAPCSNNDFVMILAEKSWKEPATLFREPKLELPLLVQFLPAMMSLIVDDQVRYLDTTDQCD